MGVIAGLWGLGGWDRVGTYGFVSLPEDLALRIRDAAGVCGCLPCVAADLGSARCSACVVKLVFSPSRAPPRARQWQLQRMC